MNKKNTFIVIGALAIIVVLSLAIFNKPKHKLPMTPKREGAIYDYAKAQMSASDYDLAIKAFEEIVSSKAKNEKKADAILNLGAIYEAKGEFLKARDYYKKYVYDYPQAKDVMPAQAKMEALNMKLLFSPVITEGSIKYLIQPKDTLEKIARAYRTTVELIRKSNGLSGDIIIPGKTLKVTTAQFSIFVDKSQNVMYLKKGGDIFKTYTVATGKDNSTPVGVFKIEEKMVSPVWYKLNAKVSPDSPDYELGTRWMGLSVKGYGIHGTKYPESIGQQVTQGCVRMKNEEVEELYSIVPSGTEVTIVD